MVSAERQKIKSLHGNRPRRYGGGFAWGVIGGLQSSGGGTREEDRMLLFRMKEQRPK